MTRHTACLALLTTLIGGFAACDGDDDTVDPVSMTAVTYNLGLAVGFVGAAEERAPLTIEAVTGIDADILCVQEVWQPNHVDLLKAAASNLPNSIFVDPDAGMTGSAACTDADTAPLLTCVTDNECDKVCSDKLVECVLDKCLTEFTALPPTCNACLQANVGQPLDTITATCKAGSTDYAFGGSFGVGMLTKYPILSQESMVFESTTNRRAVIYAELDTPLGTVHTFCTHLTAVFADIPYPKPQGSWDEEQETQINQLIQMVADKADVDGKVVVMGDMNTGPAGTGYIAEVEDNYKLFLDAGLANGYTAQADHTCTFCSDNPLLGSDDDQSVVIDHVLSRNLNGKTSAKRVLDGSIQVTNCGVTGPSAYSDHYGVSVTIEAE